MSMTSVFVLLSFLHKSLSKALNCDDMGRSTVGFTCFVSNISWALSHHFTQSQAFRDDGKISALLHAGICLKNVNLVFCDRLWRSVWQVNMLLTKVRDKRRVAEHQSADWQTVQVMDVHCQIEKAGLPLVLWDIQYCNKKKHAFCFKSHVVCANVLVRSWC